MKGGCEFLELSVTIPTSNYIQSIWFVSSFTGLAAKMAKLFIPLSLLSEGRDERWSVLCVNC